MRLNLRIAAALAAVTLSSPALADMICVQQGLTDLGFDPGPIDGAAGKRTTSAALLFATNAGLTMPPLDKQTASQWCTTINDFAATPAASTISRLDLKSEPKGILSDKEQSLLWNAYKTAGMCMEHPAWGDNPTLKIKKFDADAFAASTWTSPFTRVSGSPLCQVEPGRLNAPAPIREVTLDEAYGERLFDVDAAAKWFRRLTTYARYSDDPLARGLVKEAIIAWAKGEALTSGIRVSYGKKPVDYQMMATIGALVTATAEIAPEFSADERRLVGPWLNGLVSQVASSVWTFRYDNKPYMARAIALQWALMVNDEATIQEIILAYKLAIHDMRPDGSFPVDSQRGGMALVYNAAFAGHLVNIATMLKQARGIDLFGYEVDGRSVHTAVDFVVAAMQDPGFVNQKYAIDCTAAGDRFGSITEPSTFFIDESGSYLMSYASLFPDRESSKAIVTELGDRPAMDSEKSSGAPACLFASIGSDVSLPPLELPTPPSDLPAPKFRVASVIDGELTSPVDARAESVYLNIRSGILADERSKALTDNELNFTIKGILEPQGNVRRFMVVVNTELGVDKPAALRDCGAKTETDDIGRQRVVLDFAVTGDMLKAENIECISKALPKTAAFQADFLTTSMQDVAIGLVATGEINSVATESLRAFFNRVARGQITVARGEASEPEPAASRDPAALPKPKLVVTTSEKFVKNSGKAVEIISLLEARIKGAKKGQNRVEFTVLGNYSYEKDDFYSLDFIIQNSVGKDRPAVLDNCPGTRTEFYDGGHHVVIGFSFKDGVWAARNADCLIANLPKAQAFETEFLVTSFHDLAIGLVKSGDVKTLENDGLRNFITKVAFGELRVAKALN